MVKKDPKPKEKPEKKEPKDFIDKYGFLHIDKDLAKHLNLKFGKDQANVPVTIGRIEGGFTVSAEPETSNTRGSCS